MEILAIVVALILVGLFWRLLLRVVGVLAVAGAVGLIALLIVNNQAIGLLLLLGVMVLAVCVWAIRDYRKTAALEMLEREQQRHVDACYDMVVRR